MSSNCKKQLLGGVSRNIILSGLLLYEINVTIGDRQCSNIIFMFVILQQTPYAKISLKDPFSFDIISCEICNKRN
jgi:hypothetical protein